MADCVRAEIWAAKIKAFLQIQALIWRVLKQRKFKNDEGVSLNEQGQLFYLQMIGKRRRNTVQIKKMAGKAKKPSILLPDIKVLMLFQVTDEINIWKQFVLQFLWISSPPSFFIKKSCGTPEFHWIPLEFEHGFSPGQVILGFKPA